MAPRKPKWAWSGIEDHAFAILGSWKKAAKEAGWSAAEIQEVFNKAMEGTYEDLIKTLEEHSDAE